MAKNIRNSEEDIQTLKTCLFRNMLSQFMHYRAEKHCVQPFTLCLPNFRCRKQNNGGEKYIGNVTYSVLKRINSIIHIPTVSCCSNQVTNSTSTSASGHVKSLEDEVEGFIANESGKDRVSRAWNSRQNERSPPDEAVFILRVAQNVFLATFLYGFFQTGLTESSAFLKRSKTTLYGSPSLANKRLANVAIGKGMGAGIKLGLKSFLATTSLLGIWRGLCVYYNTSSPWTLAVATGTILSISKVSLGPKGLAGGAVIGSVLGGMAGGLLQLILISTGNTQQQINYKQIEQKIIDKRIMQRSKLGFDDEEDEIID